MYLAMASASVADTPVDMKPYEKAVRNLQGFTDLQNTISAHEQIFIRMEQAEFNSEVDPKDKNTMESVHLLTDQLNRVLDADKEQMPFSDFVSMWKKLGYYDLDLTKK